MSVYDIFDICFPSDYEVRETIAAAETSSVSYSHGLALYGRTSRLVSVVWERLRLAQGEDILRMLRGKGGEVRTFTLFPPGELEPMRVRFNSAPEIVEIGADLVAVSIEFREAL